MESLKDKIALITGSATGIGAASALKLAKFGVHLCLVDKNTEALEKTATECRVMGAKVAIVAVDLTDDLQIGRIFDQTVSNFGKLDILVNSAGATVSLGLEAVTMDVYDFLFGINTRAMFAVTQKAIPLLEKTKGCVVNIASILTQKIVPGTIVYQMTKGAVDIFTHAAALELAGKGIRVNGIQPGTVETNILINAGWSPEESHKYFSSSADQYPIGRIGRPEEIADCVCFLASDQASFITGELIRVDGGLAAGVMWDQEK